MNLAPLLQVADVIEAEVAEHNQGKMRFNMQDWSCIRTEDVNDCFTAACIAGHVCATFNHDEWLEWTQNDEAHHISEWAQKFLELDDEQASVLFVCWMRKYDEDGNFRAVNPPYKLHLRTVTEQVKYVPALLRWMAANDSVNWWDAIEAHGLKSVFNTHDRYLG